MSARAITRRGRHRLIVDARAAPTGIGETAAITLTVLFATAFFNAAFVLSCDDGWCSLRERWLPLVGRTTERFPASDLERADLMTNPASGHPLEAGFAMGSARPPGSESRAEATPSRAL